MDLYRPLPQFLSAMEAAGYPTAFAKHAEKSMNMNDVLENGILVPAFAVVSGGVTLLADSVAKGGNDRGK
jgi:hypothetical protein